MQRIVAGFLVVVLLFAFVGCNTAQTIHSDDVQTSAVTTVSKVTTTEKTTKATTKKTTRKTTKKTTTVPPTTTTTVQRARQDFQIVVEGKNIMTPLTPAYIMDENLRVVPFTAILRAVGAKIKWTSDTEATVSLKGVNYYLNTEEKKFIEEERRGEPGHSGYIKWVWAGNSSNSLKSVHFMENGEYMVDLPSAVRFFVDHIGLDIFWKEKGKDEVMCCYWGEE